VNILFKEIVSSRDEVKGCKSNVLKVDVVKFVYLEIVNSPVPN
jgi:hypothetical protein